MNETNKTLKNLGLIVALAIPVIVVAYILMAKKSANVANTAATSTTTGGIPRPVDVGPKMLFYKDGSYTATGSYISPAGPESVAVNITIANNVITDATVTPQATNPTSQKFQGIFAANYKTYVVGKNVADLKLTKVSGSSLTPKGFNDAIEKVKVEAQS